MKRPRHGFSLVELVVALCIGAALATAAIGMFLVTRGAALEAATRAQLARDAQLALDVIEGDLAFFGAGVPLGLNADNGALGGNNGASLLPIVRIGGDRHLAFVGDLPYPHSELNGVAALTHAWTNPAFPAFLLGDSYFAVTSEVSGSCTPWSSAAGAPLQCSTVTSSLVRGMTSPADCDASTPPVTGATIDFAPSRTCPWGLHKWALGASNRAYLTLVNAVGEWHERRVSSFGGQDVENYRGMIFSAGLPYTFFGFPLPCPVENLGNVWSATGGAYLTNLDRVLYAVEETAAAPGTTCAGAAGGDCALRRRQCWGRVGNPAAAAFPAAGTATFGSASNPSGCGAPDGTPWETVVTGLTDLRFRYYSDATTLLSTPLSAADAANVAAVEVALTFRRRVRGALPARFVSDTVQRRYVLPNQE